MKMSRRPSCGARRDRVIAGAPLRGPAAQMLTDVGRAATAEADDQAVENPLLAERAERRNSAGAGYRRQRARRSVQHQPHQRSAAIHRGPWRSFGHARVDRPQGARFLPQARRRHIGRAHRPGRQGGVPRHRGHRAQSHRDVPQWRDRRGLSALQRVQKHGVAESSC